jgi:hypothetical protein
MAAGRKSGATIRADPVFRPARRRLGRRAGRLALGVNLAGRARRRWGSGDSSAYLPVRAAAAGKPIRFTAKSLKRSAASGIMHALPGRAATYRPDGPAGIAVLFILPRSPPEPAGRKDECHV